MRSTRPSTRKRSALACRRAVGSAPRLALPVTVMRPSPPRSVKRSICATSPASRMLTWPSLTFTPCSRLRTARPLPVMSPVYCGSPKRPLTAALVRSSPASRQPGGTQLFQMPMSATRAWMLPSMGASGAGQRRSGVVRARRLPRISPRVRPLKAWLTLHRPSCAARARLNSVRPISCMPSLLLRFRSPSTRSNTTSASKRSRAFTSSRARSRRSPPQPAVGCSRAIKGAMGKASTSARSSMEARSPRRSALTASQRSTTLSARRRRPGSARTLTRSPSALKSSSASSSRASAQAAATGPAADLPSHPPRARRSMRARHRPPPAASASQVPRAFNCAWVPAWLGRPSNCPAVSDGATGSVPLTSMRWSASVPVMSARSCVARWRPSCTPVTSACNDRSRAPSLCSCQRAWPPATVSVPTCNCCSRRLPEVRMAGQRPSAIRSPCTLPWRGRAAASVGCRAASGARLASLSARTCACQRSPVPVPEGLPWASSTTWLPPSTSSACSTMPGATVGSAAAAAATATRPRLSSACSGTPASTERCTRSVPRPSSDCSRASGARRVVSAGRRTSICQSPDNRCGPLRQAVPASPGHQGRGSKSVSWPAVSICQAPLTARCRLSRSSALAAPLLARTSRSCTPCALALPLSARRTGCGLAAMAPCRSSVQSTARGGRGVLAAGSGEGRPLMRAIKGPPSDMFAARPSRRCGLTSTSRVSMSRVWSSQVARPPQRPAPRVRLLGPSANQTSKRVASRRLGACAWPLSSSSSRRTGRRPSFQRPGVALSSSSLAATGASRAVVRMSALPARRVCGAPGHSAARSSAAVRTASAPSGQAASGRTWAARSSAGAGCPPRATPRSVAFTSSCSSTPSARSTAAQSGAAALASGVTVSCATTGSGALLPMLAWPATALPSQRSDSVSTPWRRPGLPSRRRSRSRASRTGARLSTTSSPTRTSFRCAWAGNCNCLMSAGVPLDTVVTTTRWAVSDSPSSRSQTPVSGRHCQRMPRACRASMTTLLP